MDRVAPACDQVQQTAASSLGTGDLVVSEETLWLPSAPLTVKNRINGDGGETTAQVAWPELEAAIQTQGCIWVSD